MHRADLQWDDRGVLPDRFRPDVAFLFERMNRATLEVVDPRQGERILDVGCGRATDMLAMSRTGATVIGIEPSFPMLMHARKSLRQDGQLSSVIQAVGESIPLLAGSIDKALCKGALDHFSNPGLAISQMAAAIKPCGRVIVAVANFESFGFKLGKLIFGVRKILGIKNPYPRLPWELPPDHTVKFDYRSIIKMFEENLRLTRVVGVSLLCSAPGWGDMLEAIPHKTSNFILQKLDKIARLWPCLSDVIIVEGAPK